MPSESLVALVPVVLVGVCYSELGASCALSRRGMAILTAVLVVLVSVLVYREVWL